MKPLSIYIHYPFCKAKCPYCDFNSHIFKQIDEKAFLQAYLSELNFFAPKLKNRQIKTIFFGGGTPSLMPVYFVEKILAEIAKIWEIDKNCEISLEANPTSFEANKFRDFKKAGINRLSIGIQALNDSDLKFLGREHSSKEAIFTIETASKIFDNYSFDLIYGRPTQNLQSWQQELKTAISLSANHLSLYQLTIEKGTKFYGQHLKQEFKLPEDDILADLYQMSNEISCQNGLEIYEISNYAKSGFECRHNLAYWQSKDYLGIGAGAHSRIYFDNEINKKAIVMLHQPDSWLKKIEKEGVAIQTIIDIDKQELFQELILMGLRLIKGINQQQFRQHFGKNINEILNLKKLSDLIDQNFLKITNNNISITNKGLIFTDSIIKKVLNSQLL